ncbi:hypothetical protein BCR34DRAFT_602326 [Clohesyomyces aquaticus]|uniref:Uncharacterized protein n=1 Tax=Clohesyomyces aquaticus TaxID=1231657 RepID=A0A1Y1ZIM9_9PLEO|nr:hypothetical protein BCR34DRAFT_602326 [Clohesyomyces aquaticus]
MIIAVLALVAGAIGLGVGLARDHARDVTTANSRASGVTLPKTVYVTTTTRTAQAKGIMDQTISETIEVPGPTMQCAGGNFNHCSLVPAPTAITGPVTGTS